MTTGPVDPARVTWRGERGMAEGRYVLYWMQQAQRSHDNPALDAAIAAANRRGLPVVVAFGVTADFPEANARHFAFLLEGLAEVATHLRERGIAFVLREGEPPAVALTLAREAALLVCDRGYLRIQRQWRDRVAAEAPCPVVEIETDAVVPVETASDKAETAARTMRPRILRQREHFLAPVGPEEPTVRADDLDLASDHDPADPAAVLRALPVDHAVSPVTAFRGGYSQAREHLATFLDQGLPRYRERGADPVADVSSHLAAYLHFGQIAPMEVARAVQSADAPQEEREGYLEQLIVRRELSINHVWYRPDHYDAYSCLPDWAQRTLAEHASDPRDPCYTWEILEAAETADPYWNAAMTDMRSRGFMPNYLRMYWGKKILEWSPTPEEGFATALALNNKYFLDGRDANAFANVAWCFGLHDRGWPERAIFGKVRYMNASGLKRKFRIDEYVQAVKARGV
ncbi:MAG TPA: deoxyribodipyrimidine photo-lyase [Gammaproteobacteria bacterium]|nr:deoxyribodipyrimidine photo-lyase [Gammaproteobacteria bacterium]